MTVCPLRIHWLAVVTALTIAVVLSACSEPTATPMSAPTYAPTLEPTATPKSAPTYTPTPEPILTQVSTPAYSDELDLDADSVWQEAFNAFRASEQVCIRNELGEEFLGSVLGLGVMEEGETEHWQATIFECLDPETAGALFFSTLMVGLAEVEGFDDEMAACLKELMADSNVAGIIAGTLPDAGPESAYIVEEFTGGFAICLGEPLLPDSGGPAAGPPPPGDSLLWQYSTGEPDESLILSPTISEGVVYAASRENPVYALDAESGELLWSLEGDSVFNPPPLADGGVVLVNGHALDGSTGALLWSDESVRDRTNNAALMSGGTVYTPTEGRDDLSVRAIDAASGEQLWETDVPRSSDVPLLFPLTAAGSNILVSDEFQVHALDSTTGSLVWSFDPGDIVRSLPASSNGVVYLRSYSAAYALDDSTGEQLWSYQIDIGDPTVRPTVADGVCYLWGPYGVLHALDAATGRLLWSFNEDHVYRAAAAEGLVFVGAAVAFYALDAATGDPLWSLDNQDWGLFSVLAVDGVLYAGSNGYLHTMDARTGVPIWSVEIGHYPGGPDEPYLVSGGVVYVGYNLADSGVYAFAAPGRG